MSIEITPTPLLNTLSSGFSFPFCEVASDDFRKVKEYTKCFYLQFAERMLQEFDIKNKEAFLLGVNSDLEKTLSGYVSILTGQDQTGRFVPAGVSWEDFFYLPKSEKVIQVNLFGERLCGSDTALQEADAGFVFSSQLTTDIKRKPRFSF